MATTRQILVKFLSFEDEDHAGRKGKFPKRFPTKEKAIVTSSKTEPKLKLQTIKKLMQMS